MASFAQTLRTYHTGRLSAEELLKEIDDILADGRASAAWMLDKLTEEDTTNPLPPELHQAVKEKIEAAARNEDLKGATSASDPQADQETLLAEQTRLATVIGAENPSRSEPAREFNAVSNGAASDYRIKGTGDVLNNRFELEECLGSGGMSTVYKALDRRKLEASDRNPYVAVKVLNLEFRAHPDSLIALQREAKKSQNLAHPNIVRVYDFDRDGSTVYMTMEYLLGESLGRKIGAPNFKGMSAEDALPIVNKMGHALAFAHDYGIVHADFKPANVFITDSGEVKVIDFGIARAFQRADDTAMEATRFDPRSLGALTPTYASPEMLEHKEPDPRDDIYALACTTYEILTGRHPFGRMQATAAREGGLQLKRHKELTARQFKALQKALAFDRDKRTPTVNQFLSEINANGSLETRIALSAIVAGALILVAVGLGYFYSSGKLSGPGTTTQIADVQAPVSAPPSRQSAPSPPSSKPPAEKVEQPKVPPVATREAPTAPRELPKPEATLPEVSLATITPLVQRVPCSAIQADVDKHVVTLSGYASKPTLNRIKSELNALAGVSEVNSRVMVIGNDQCDVLDLISPFLLANREFGLNTTIATKDGSTELGEGEDIVLRLTTPPFDSYVNVDYFSLDGGVLHMVPNPFTPNKAPANYTATIGDLGEWRVAPPFGTEMIVLIATPEPLFDSLRAESEPKAKYLSDLKKRLTELARQDNKNRIAADVVFITTRKGS